MSRSAAVFASVLAAVAASFAVAAGPDLGPVSVASTEAAVAWHCANDPEYIERHEDLEAQIRATLARRMYRSELVGRVVAGDLSLADAAAEFLLINQEIGATSLLRWRFPGRSDEELAHWNVIVYVRNQAMPAGEKARALARLGGEFEARFGRPPCGRF